MKKTKQLGWLVLFLTALCLATWLTYRTLVRDLGPYIDKIWDILTYSGLVLMMLIVIISSIGLVNANITKDTILKNYTRAKIFTLIKTKPGIHYNEIVKNLELSRGQTTWHLRYLERYDMIKRMKTKQFVIFYPNDGVIDENESNIQLVLMKSETRNRIFDCIIENPGITQNNLMHKLNISQSKLAYHLIILEDLDIIYIQKKGRIRFYFVNKNEIQNNYKREINIPG
ncbi:MAG: winged helix-turn-helix transcriptional regulator [Asgard group archaeon]|nr:winged helix-turn-helix transcriptional regulator [Asgard group archaeon]